MKNILILTAGLGEEAHGAASHLSDALKLTASEDLRVDTLDLFDTCYGRFHHILRQTYQSTANHLPLLWKSLNQLMENPPLRESNLDSFRRLQTTLRDVLQRYQPDVVVSLHPYYNQWIEEIYREGREKNFVVISMVLELLTPLSPWHRAESDFYLVAGPDQFEALQIFGIPEAKIKITGLPVSLTYAQQDPPIVTPDLTHGRPHLLLLLPEIGKKARKLLQQMIAHEDWDVTVYVGRDAELSTLAHEAAKDAPERVKVMGWTRQMPRLLLGHHLVIGRPPRELLPDLAAARCPLVAFPAAEKEGFDFLREKNVGVLAQKVKQAIVWIERAFAEQGRLYQLWRKNLTPLGQPDGAFQIARFVLSQAVPEMISLPTVKASETSLEPSVIRPFFTTHPTGKQLLLCDLHTHTTWSDGKLTIRELVDFYGQRNFDCLCVTDHLCDPKRLLGQLVNLTGLVIPPDEVADYFDAIEREKKRAWDKYDLLLLSGVEFNKDGYTPKTSAHLLGIDLKQPIDPSLDLKSLIREIHDQGALAIASHPNEFQSEWGKDTLYLWENQEEYAPLLDAWEVANRDDIYNPVALKKLPFVANSDFHKPKHIYSWKTLLHCEKEVEAIKQCIRVNRDVSLSLYRDDKHLGQESRARVPMVAPPATEVAPLVFPADVAAVK